MITNSHNLGVIEGKYVNLREVSINDAEFILELRLSDKAKILHHTDSALEKQRDYLRCYLEKLYEWYFIVEDKQGNSIGCLSIYDVKGDSVCTGRWIMKDMPNATYGIEGDLLLKEFAYNILNASEIRMDTRLENSKMRAFFKIWGCSVVSTDDSEVYVTLSREQYLKQKKLIERFCA